MISKERLEELRRLAATSEQDRKWYSAISALQAELTELRAFRDRINAYVIPGVADTSEAIQKIVREHARFKAALEKAMDTLSQDAGMVPVEMAMAIHRSLRKE